MITPVLGFQSLIYHAYIVQRPLNARNVLGFLVDMLFVRGRLDQIGGNEFEVRISADAMTPVCFR